MWGGATGRVREGSTLWCHSWPAETRSTLVSPFAPLISVQSSYRRTISVVQTAQSKNGSQIKRVGVSQL